MPTHMLLKTITVLRSCWLIDAARTRERFEMELKAIGAICADRHPADLVYPYI